MRRETLAVIHPCLGPLRPTGGASGPQAVPLSRARGYCLRRRGRPPRRGKSRRGSEMNAKTLVRLATSPLAWLVLLAALVLGACAWRFHRDRREVDVTGWDIARLVDHLHSRGLSLRV